MHYDVPIRPYLANPRIRNKIKEKNASRIRIVRDSRSTKRPQPATATTEEEEVRLEFNYTRLHSRAHKWEHLHRSELAEVPLPLPTYIVAHIIHILRPHAFLEYFQ